MSQGYQQQLFKRGGLSTALDFYVRKEMLLVSYSHQGIAR